MYIMSRRDMVKTSAVFLASLLVSPSGLFAKEKEEVDLVSNSVKAEINKILKGRKAKQGIVKIDLPNIADNGANVPLAIKAKDIKASRVLIWIDKNPFQKLFDLSFSNLFAGNAEISTKIRMRESSPVRLIIIDEKGSVFSDSKIVQVTMGGCNT